MAVIAVFGHGRYSSASFSTFRQRAFGAALLSMPTRVPMIFRGGLAPRSRYPSAYLYGPDRHRSIPCVKYRQAASQFALRPTELFQ